MAAKKADEYIQKYPKQVQLVLKNVRAAIRKAAPKAEELIAYGMVGYRLNGKPLVYFGGWKEHVGFYALPSGHAKFKKELAGYAGAKGSVRFPLSKPMPLALIARMVKFRVQELTKNMVEENDIPTIGAPALRALHGVRVQTLADLKKFTEERIANLHGMGPKALGILKKEMRRRNYSFAR